MDTATITRYDIQAILMVDTAGVHYGAISTRNVTRAIGPVAHRGYVLVDDGSEIYDVLEAQLRIARRPAARKH